MEPADYDDFSDRDGEKRDQKGHDHHSARKDKISTMAISRYIATNGLMTESAAPPPNLRCSGIIATRKSRDVQIMCNQSTLESPPMPLQAERPRKVPATAVDQPTGGVLIQIGTPRAGLLSRLFAVSAASQGCGAVRRHARKIRCTIHSTEGIGKSCAPTDFRLDLFCREPRPYCATGVAVKLFAPDGPGVYW